MDSRRDPPFSPPPQRSGVGTIALALCAVLALLYFGSEWALRHRPVVSPPPTQPVPKTEPNYAPNPPSAQSSPPAPSPRQITKCVEHGKTSYSDRGCAPNATATYVSPRTDLNLMDAPRFAPVPPGQPIVVAPYPPAATYSENSPAPDTAAQCKQLEVQIAYWDELARQPQTGPTQDWISSQRKQARDTQFRIRCR